MPKKPEISIEGMSLAELLLHPGVNHNRLVSLRVGTLRVLAQSAAVQAQDAEIERLRAQVVRGEIAERLLSRLAETLRGIPFDQVGDGSITAAEVGEYIVFLRKPATSAAEPETPQLAEYAKKQVEKARKKHG